MITACVGQRFCLSSRVVVLLAMLLRVSVFRLVSLLVGEFGCVSPRPVVRVVLSVGVTKLLPVWDRSVHSGYRVCLS